MPDSPTASSERTTLSALEIVNRYFLENRARLLDIAAFLDRVDQARESERGQDDHRYRALVKGIRLVLECDGQRARAVLSSLSDPTSEPIPAAGEKGAQGAFAGTAS